MRPAEAVLLTGLYGVGKSTVAAEIADLLESAGVPYAALDLDWLAWCNAGGGGRTGEHALMLRNLAAVVATYRAAGARYYVLARWVRDGDELAGVAATMAMPVRTVELTVPLAEIERRLAPDPTAGRRDDLAASAAWAADPSRSVAEHVVANDRPVRTVATDVVRWLSWPLPVTGGAAR